MENVIRHSLQRVLFSCNHIFKVNFHLTLTAIIDGGMDGGKGGWESQEERGRKIGAEIEGGRDKEREGRKGEKEGRETCNT